MQINIGAALLARLLRDLGITQTDSSVGGESYKYKVKNDATY